MALNEYERLIAINCPFPLMQTVGDYAQDTFSILERMPGGAILCWHTGGKEELHIADWKSQGKDVWIYTTRGPRFPAPSISTSGMAAQVRGLAWQCFSYNYSHYLIWDIATPGNSRQGFAYQGWSGGSLLYYRPGGGYYESTRLELVREGFEDYDYFALLARQPTSTQQTILLTRAKALSGQQVYQPEMDYRAFEALRIEIGEFLSQ